MSSFWKVIIAGAIHLLGVVLVYFCFLQLGVTDVKPTNGNLLNWDASWYHSIMTEGYHYVEDQQSNAGFFPGFPMVWKLIQSSPLVISLLNYVLFVLGLALLVHSFKINWKYAIVALGIPSLFFMYLPYSEALNYLVGVLLLIAFTRKKWLLFYLALLVICLIRPQLFFILPAAIGVFVYQKYTKFGVKELLFAIFTILLGTMISFATIDYLSGANDLFAYSKSQVGNWSHEFSWPSFPLTTWRGYRVLWLDMMAYFLAGMAAAYPLNSLVKSVREGKITAVNSGMLFSSIVVAMSLILVTFFHLAEDGRTSVLSLNRYVLCNPFLHYLVLSKLFSMKEMSLTKFGIIAFIALVVVTIFGFPYFNVVGLNKGKTLIFYAGITIVMISSVFFLLKTKLTRQTVYIFVFYLFGLTLQTYLLQSFLKGNWIG